MEDFDTASDSSIRNSEHNRAYKAMDSQITRRRVKRKIADAESDVWDFERVLVEMNAKDGFLILFEELCRRHRMIEELQSELEKERNASASAAEAAMAAITRLEKEKHEVQMEYSHFKRLAEGKLAHFQHQVKTLESLLYMREEAITALEFELRALKHRCLGLGFSKFEFERIGPVERHLMEERERKLSGQARNRCEKSSYDPGVSPQTHYQLRDYNQELYLQEHLTLKREKRDCNEQHLQEHLPSKNERPDCNVTEIDVCTLVEKAIEARLEKEHLSPWESLENLHVRVQQLEQSSRDYCLDIELIAAKKVLQRKLEAYAASLPRISTVFDSSCSNSPQSLNPEAFDGFYVNNNSAFNQAEKSDTKGSTDNATSGRSSSTSSPQDIFFKSVDHKSDGEDSFSHSFNRYQQDSFFQSFNRDQVKQHELVRKINEDSTYTKMAHTESQRRFDSKEKELPEQNDSVLFSRCNEMSGAKQYDKMDSDVLNHTQNERNQNTFLNNVTNQACEAMGLKVCEPKRNGLNTCMDNETASSGRSAFASEDAASKAQAETASVQSQIEKLVLRIQLLEEERNSMLKQMQSLKRQSLHLALLNGLSRGGVPHQRSDKRHSMNALVRGRSSVCAIIKWAFTCLLKRKPQRHHSRHTFAAAFHSVGLLLLLEKASKRRMAGLITRADI